MAYTGHPLRAVIDACDPLRFAPLPDVPGIRMRTPEHPPIEQWHRADLASGDGTLACLYDKMISRHGPHHRLASVHHVLRSLLREPVFLVSAGIYLTGRAPALAADRLWFPWHAEDAFGTPLTTETRVGVLPDDPFAGHPDAVVLPDRQALDRWAAEHLVETFSPVITAIHEHSRMGVRNLWGWVADSLYFYMLNPARFLGNDAAEAWERATGLMDEVERAGALLRRRPRLFPFCRDHPHGTWAVRGTCCFDYKAEQTEHGGDYCLTCPLKDDESRQEKLMGWLQTPVAS